MSGIGNGPEDIKKMAAAGDIEAVRNNFLAHYHFPPPLEPVNHAINDFFNRIMVIQKDLDKTIILGIFVKIALPQLDDESWLLRYNRLRNDKTKTAWANLAKIWYKAFDHVLTQAEEDKDENSRLDTFILLAQSFEMWFTIPSDDKAYRLWMTGVKAATTKTEKRGRQYIGRALGRLTEAFHPDGIMAIVASFKSKTKKEPGHKMQAYCMKCRIKREAIFYPIIMKNGKPATQGICPVCGTKMFRIGKNGGSGESEPPPKPATPRIMEETMAPGLEVRSGETVPVMDMLIMRHPEVEIEGNISRLGLDIGPKPNPVARYVNLWFTSEHSDESPIPREKPLVKDKTAYLLAQIAAYDTKTILAEAEKFPDYQTLVEAFRELEGKIVPLEVVLYSGDFEIPEGQQIQELILNKGEATKILYFPVKPLNTGTGKLHLHIFYLNNLLQSLEITAVVTEKEQDYGGMQSARVETTFSADFRNLGEMKPRFLCLGINKGNRSTHYLNIKAGKIPLYRKLDDQKINEAIETAHKALRKVAFESRGVIIETDNQGRPVLNSDGTPKVKSGGELIYRFDADNKPFAGDQDTVRAGMERRFKEDIALLASAGSVIHYGILGSGYRVPQEEMADERTQANLTQDILGGISQKTIQVARLKAADAIWPWSLMYDLVVDTPDKIREVCLDFRTDSKVKPYHECRKDCQHNVWKDSNDGSVVCPYGFWGFRYIIEQPFGYNGDTKNTFGDLPRKIIIGEKPVLKMPVDIELLNSVTNHSKEMNALKFDIISSSAAMHDACLTPPPPHVMYFFCHGMHPEGGVPYLVIGNDEHLLPTAIDKWHLNWGNTHTLVFINGCSTADLGPKSLAAIMDPFVNVGVSGIIGTEIPVPTCLAAEFAAKFFKRFLPNGTEGKPAGEVMLEIRLELLGKYNPLGLVYTPFCSADLCAAIK